MKNTNHINFTIDRDKKIEDFFDEINISYRLKARLFREKNVKVNGVNTVKNMQLFKGDIVSIKIEDENCDVEPEEMELDILYEDEDIIAINKPPFTVVHQTRSHLSGTLSNGISYYFMKSGLKRKVRLINRLDRDTSGILLVAKNSFAHQQMALQMEKESVLKEYTALCEGVVEKDYGEIDLPIGRVDEMQIKREVMNDGKESVTKYEVAERYKDATLLKVRIITGRSHQIRVHMAHIGHPLIGDELYNKKSELINRQALHSSRMVFKKIRDGATIEIVAPPPFDMRNLIVGFKGMSF